MPATSPVLPRRRKGSVVVPPDSRAAAEKDANKKAAKDFSALITTATQDQQKIQRIQSRMVSIDDLIGGNADWDYAATSIHYKAYTLAKESYQKVRASDKFFDDFLSTTIYELRHKLGHRQFLKLLGANKWQKLLEAGERVETQLEAMWAVHNAGMKAMKKPTPQPKPKRTAKEPTTRPAKKQKREQQN